MVAAVMNSPTSYEPCRRAQEYLPASTIFPVRRDRGKTPSAPASPTKLLSPAALFPGVCVQAREEEMQAAAAEIEHFDVGCHKRLKQRADEEVSSTRPPSQRFPRMCAFFRGFFRAMFLAKRAAGLCLFQKLLVRSRPLLLHPQSRKQRAANVALKTELDRVTARVAFCAARNQASHTSAFAAWAQVQKVRRRGTGRSLPLMDAC